MLALQGPGVAGRQGCKQGVEPRPGGRSFRGRAFANQRRVRPLRSVPLPQLVPRIQGMVQAAEEAGPPGQVTQIVTF